ncbi:MAG: hypothetical protein IJP91_09190 [Synergistaceae bacterium]|nr:hypothetical protein [Synergistaceae bacterium]
MSLTAYVIRAVAALIVMSLGALFLVKYMKKYNPAMKSTSAVEILSSLHLTSRDIFFVVHCGPEVVSFVLTQSGACVIGRWSYEEWLKTEKKD